jgi:hypothetical protein
MYGCAGRASNERDGAAAANAGVLEGRKLAGGAAPWAIALRGVARVCARASPW